MNRWLNWIQGIQQEIKGFLFFSILFTLFRIVFLSFSVPIGYGYDEWHFDVLVAGFRLSLKTVGNHCARRIALWHSAIYHMVQMEAQGVRKRVWYGLVTILFTLSLWGASRFIPYSILRIMRCLSMASMTIFMPLSIRVNQWIPCYPIF